MVDLSFPSIEGLRGNLSNLIDTSPNRYRYHKAESHHFQKACISSIIRHRIFGKNIHPGNLTCPPEKGKLLKKGKDRLPSINYRVRMFIFRGVYALSVCKSSHGTQKPGSLEHDVPFQLW